MKPSLGPRGGCRPERPDARQAPARGAEPMPFGSTTVRHRVVATPAALARPRQRTATAPLAHFSAGPGPLRRHCSTDSPRIRLRHREFATRRLGTVNASILSRRPQFRRHTGCRSHFPATFQSLPNSPDPSRARGEPNDKPVSQLHCATRLPEPPGRATVARRSSCAERGLRHRCGGSGRGPEGSRPARMATGRQNS